MLGSLTPHDVLLRGLSATCDQDKRARPPVCASLNWCSIRSGAHTSSTMPSFPLAAPGVYQELVGESRWTPAEFEQFVADSLERQLL